MINRDKFFENYKNEFGSLEQKQVDSINAVIDSFEADPNFQYLAELAYVLATFYHEAKFEYDIREIGKGKGRGYGRPDKITGQTYYGRGPCQLTHKYNYEKFSKILSKDLVNEPDLALEKENAIKILMYGMFHGSFTGKALKDYIDEDSVDFLNARRIVNGKDKAKLIADYADKFYEIIKNSEG